MDKQDESYLDNLLQEYSKEPPIEDNRRKRAGKKVKKSDTDLMLDSLEEEFNNEIDGISLEDIDFDNLEEELSFSGKENKTETVLKEVLPEEETPKSSTVSEEGILPEVTPQSSEEVLSEMPKEELLKESPTVSEEVLPEMPSMSDEEVLQPTEQVLSEEFGGEKELTSEDAAENLLADLEESLGDLAGDLFGSEIGTEELFSDLGDSGEASESGLGFEEPYEISGSTHGEDSLEEKTTKKKKKKAPSKQKGGFFKFFGKLFANVPLTEEELNAIPTPEQELEAKKQKAEDAKLKKEEKKAKAEADKKQKAEEAKQKAAEKQAKKKAKEEAKKEAKKNAELKRLRAEAALPPEGKINKAGAAIVLLVFLLMGAVIIFGSSILSYNNSIAGASNKFNKKEYNAAYQKIRGIDVKEKDMEIRDKIHTVMFVNKQLNSYNNFYNMGNYANALDALIKGLFRYDKYIAYATQIGIKSDLNYVRKQIMAELEDTYQMSERDALVLMGVIDKKEYSENVYKIASQIKKKKKPLETEKKEFVP